MVSSLGNSSSATLQNIQQRQSGFFRKRDSDGRGGLSIDEFSAMLANTPADGPKIDRPRPGYDSTPPNGDGNLSAGEMQTGMPTV